MVVLTYLQQKAYRRFRDGSPGPWGAIAAGLFGFRMLMRLSRRNGGVVYRGVLKPGETITVTHRPETMKAVKKHEKRSRKSRRRGSEAVVADA